MGAAKYKIRLFTINYSKIQDRSRRANLTEVEEKLRCCKEKCDAAPSIQNVKELECIQANYDELYDFVIYLDFHSTKRAL